MRIKSTQDHTLNQRSTQSVCFWQGAIVTCVARGGPAERNNKIMIGDRVVFVDDLDVQALLNRVSVSFI